MKDKNNNIKYKGGTTTDLNFEKAFYTFLYNSKISFFTNGGSGLIFKCDLNDSFKNNSPYYSFSCNNYGEKVTTLIIKVIFINESVNKKNKKDFTFQLNNSNIFQESPQSFLNELHIQSDICLKTIRYLEPITPIIIYSDILSNQNSKNFINILRNNFNGDVRILDYIEMLISNFFVNKTDTKGINVGPFANYPSYPNLSMLGIIGMEMLGNNYQSMYNYYYKNIFTYDSFNTKLENYYKNVMEDNKLFNEYRLFKEKIKNEKNEENTKKLNEYIKIFNENNKTTSIMRKSLDNIVNDINKNLKFDLYKNMARLNIINIAFYTGINHADYHFKNILIDPNYIGYYKNSNIDFDNNMINLNKPNINDNLNSNDSEKFYDVSLENEKVNTPLNNSNNNQTFHTPNNNLSYFIDINDSNTSNSKNYFENDSNKSNSKNSENNSNKSNNKNSEININNYDSNFNKLDKMVGGLYDTSINIDKGKVMIIDFGYSNLIDSKQFINLQEDYEYIFDKLNNIQLYDFKENINNILKIIHETPRKDKVKLSSYEAFYDWFIGKFYCSMCEGPSGIFRLDGITDTDAQQMLDLIKSRKNSIDYLVSNISKYNIPIELPLTDEMIKKKAFNAVNVKYKPTRYKGGSKNNINDIIYNCFKSIGYGLVSIDNVEEKINNLYSKNIINKPFKMIDTINNQQSISVGVMGGLKRNKTKKYIKNKKNKFINKRKLKTIKKNKSKRNRK